MAKSGFVFCTLALRPTRADGEIKNNISVSGLGKVVEMHFSMLLPSEYGYRPWKWHKRKAKEDSGSWRRKASWFETVAGLLMNPPDRRRDPGLVFPSPQASNVERPGRFTLPLAVMPKIGEQESSARRSNDNKWPGEEPSVPPGPNTPLLPQKQWYQQGVLYFHYCPAWEVPSSLWDGESFHNQEASVGWA